jgi:SAM-dependent methyltransferase
LLLDVVETHSHRGRLLDVGSGFGYMLKLAREDGYDAVGIEASSAAARLSKAAFKVEPIVGFFPEHKFEPCSFDAVVMNHVLEHMPDPFGAMVEAERILKPGGIVAVMFPNYASVMRWLMKDRWPGLQPSQHIWQLSSASVRMMMGTAGLEVSTPHAGSLDYHRGDRPWHKWLLWQALLLSAERVGLGDNEIMIGEKPIWRVKVKRLK